MVIKTLFLILILTISILAQISQFLVFSIKVSELSGRSQELQVGIDPLATNGIDGNLGEYLLPPMPPAGVFDARLILPNQESSLKDIRNGATNTFVTKEHIIQFQVGIGATIIVTWELPKGVIGRLQDRVIGTIIDEQMIEKGSYVLSNPGTISSLKMTITYLLGELPIPILISPLNNSIGIELLPTIKWKKTAYSSNYHVQVAKDALFNNIIYEDSTLTDTIKQIKGMEGQTKYFWKVRGQNKKGYGTWSDVWNFTTIKKSTYITGTISYANGQNTPIYKAVIYLTINNGIIDSSETDEKGIFQFSNINDGIYTFLLKIINSWGGVNSTDALQIRRYLAGHTTFDSLQAKAADVNGSGLINSTDALLIRKRIAGEIFSFSTGDWIFENPFIAVQSAAININIHILCTGDVNGSFSP